MLTWALYFSRYFTPIPYIFSTVIVYDTVSQWYRELEFTIRQISPSLHSHDKFQIANFTEKLARILYFYQSISSHKQGFWVEESHPYKCAFLLKTPGILYFIVMCTAKNRYEEFLCETSKLHALFRTLMHDLLDFKWSLLTCKHVSLFCTILVQCRVFQFLIFKYSKIISYTIQYHIGYVICSLSL